VNRHRMFLRLFSKALTVRRGRTLAGLLAVAVAATVATAALTLYVDIEAKLQKEFRSYGANVIVTAREGALPAGSLDKVRAVIEGRGNAVPFAYAIAKRPDGSAVVVAGADFASARRMNAWWAVSKWPAEPGEALLGERAARVLAPTNEPFQLSFEGRAHSFRPAGILLTGSDEDSRVYLALDEFTAWTGVGASTIEVAITGSGEQVRGATEQLARALPSAEVRPIRQIVEAEGKLLSKTQALMLATVALIILTAVLCLLATLTASVFERRKDFAVMKALGASQTVINAAFVAEAALIALAGALAGYLLGSGVAAWIGRVNFHAAVEPRLVVLPAVLAGSVALAMLSALGPLRLLQRVQPATILKGE
jgi:putative ABC transport system permease protein